MTYVLTLNAPIAIKVVCFSRLLKCLRSLYGKKCGPRPDCSYKAVCSGSTLFASILNSSVMLCNYLQQTTSADDFFRCSFLYALRVNNRHQELLLCHNRNQILNLGILKVINSSFYRGIISSPRTKIKWSVDKVLYFKNQ